MKTSANSLHVLQTLCALGTLAALPLHADVKLPAIFGDHMVLQQETKVPVWGIAASGEKVIVTAGDHTGTTTADADGKWRVDLEPFAPNTPPITVTVTGRNTLTFSDVLIGEVWVASGQSNMEWSLGATNTAAEEVPKANDPQLRLFYVEHRPSIDLQSDLGGRWVLCTPDTARPFSAVAYFFGRDLRTKFNRPVGIIDSCVGGTPARSWISLSGLEKEPPFTQDVDFAKKVKVDMPQTQAQFAEYRRQMDDWNSKYKAAYEATIATWTADVAQAKAANQPAPPRPAPPAVLPLEPTDPAQSRYTPTVLFNGMIAPLMPYAIKGVIWYQGEDNAIKPEFAVEYRTLFPRLITDWREKWGQGDFPFLFVQLAGFEGNGFGLEAINWPLLREAQAMTLSLVKTGMVTAVDLGAGMDIHPPDKIDMGARLALDARHVAYGEDLVYTGPTYDKMTVEGTAVRVSYTNTGGGLIIGSAPWTTPAFKPVPTTSLLGFTIAGADKKFVLADAKIDGNTVVVSSPQVATPVAVRYYWDMLTQANLYNKEGLPAFPFRTDTWDDVPSPAIAPLPAR